MYLFPNRKMHINKREDTKNVFTKQCKTSGSAKWVVKLTWICTYIPILRWQSPSINNITSLKHSVICYCLEKNPRWISLCVLCCYLFRKRKKYLLAGFIIQVRQGQQVRRPGSLKRQSVTIPRGDACHIIAWGRWGGGTQGCTRLAGRRNKEKARARDFVVGSTKYTSQAAKAGLGLAGINYLIGFWRREGCAGCLFLSLGDEGVWTDRALDRQQLCKGSDSKYGFWIG